MGTTPLPNKFVDKFFLRVRQSFFYVGLRKFLSYQIYLLSLLVKKISIRNLNFYMLTINTDACCPS